MPTVEKIKRPWMPDTYKETRKQDPFYASTSWRKLRAAVMIDEPLCWYCQQAGRAHPRMSKIGDHFRSKKLFPELALTRSNIRGCCDYHHYVKGIWERGLANSAAFETGIQSFLLRLKQLR
jgi:5-methylcytosine-specific restriction endonuclease McrA